MMSVARLTPCSPHTACKFSSAWLVFATGTKALLSFGIVDWEASSDELSESLSDERLDPLVDERPRAMPAYLTVEVEWILSRIEGC